VLEFDVYALCRRVPRAIETFLMAYADLDQLDRPCEGHEVEVERPFPQRVLRRRWVPVGSLREAVNLGLAHPDWAFVELVPTATGVPTDFCSCAFTRDGYAVLGLPLVDPGCAADDGHEVDPVPVLETLVEQLDAQAGFIGWEASPFGSAKEFEEMLQGYRSDEVGYVRLDLPRWFHGTWLRPA
jgi:hypothetical protein